MPKTLLYLPNDAHLTSSSRVTQSILLASVVRVFEFFLPPGSRRKFLFVIKAENPIITGYE